MTNRSRSLVVLWAFALAPGPARAERSIRVFAAGTCPAPAALELAVRQAMGNWTLGATDDDRSVALRVSDFGASYRVSVAGHDRDFSDAARRCDERARSAAVFAALTLDPPILVEPVTPVAPIPPPAARPLSPLAPLGALPPPRPFEIHFDLEAAGEVAVAPRSAGTAATGGGGLRLALSTRYLGITAGIAALAPVSLSLDRGRAILDRVPIDLSLRLMLRRGRFEAALDGGLALTIVGFKGDGFAIDQGQTQLDLGLRLALGLRIWLGARLALFAAAQIEIAPARELAVGAAVVGTTPAVWIGGAAGLVVRIR